MKKIYEVLGINGGFRKFRYEVLGINGGFRK
jgi:hypothetical protein